MVADHRRLGSRLALRTLRGAPALVRGGATDVDEFCIGNKPDTPTELFSSSTEIQVFGVHERFFVKPAKAVPSGAAHNDDRSDSSLDHARLRMIPMGPERGLVAVGNQSRDTRCSDKLCERGRVWDHTRLQCQILIQEPWHGQTHRRILERSQKPPDATLRMCEGVTVDKKVGVATERLGTEVNGAGEADVLL